MKKAWETFQAGRAEKAMRTRQKFLDSLHIQPINETPTTISDVPTSTEISSSTISSTTEPSSPVVRRVSSGKKSASPTKKGSIREETPKPMELTPLQVQIDESLFHEPPFSKPKINLPPLDLQPFIK